MTTLILVTAIFTIAVFMAAVIQSSATSFRNKVRKLESARQELEITLHDLKTDVTRLKDKERAIQKKLEAYRELEAFRASRAGNGSDDNGLLLHQGKRDADPKKDPVVAHLLNSGLIDRDGIEQALKRKKLTNDPAPLPDVLVKMGLVDAATVQQVRRELG